MTDLVQLQLPFDYLDVDVETTKLIDINPKSYEKDFLGVFLCTSGRVEVNIDDHLYTIQKGDMYFFTPSVFVHTLHVSTDLRGMAIRVDYDFVTPVINNILDIRSQLFFRSNPCLSLTESQFDNIKYLFKSLQERIKNESNENITGQRRIVVRELIKSIGNTIIYELVNLLLSSHPMEPLHQERTDLLVNEFIVNIYKNYHKHREVNFYADKLCITSSYLSGLVKTKTGKPALQWIIDLVIYDAKNQLQYSNASIKEITISLNFPTQSFFGKYFKQYVGMSPKAYRKMTKS